MAMLTVAVLPVTARPRRLVATPGREAGVKVTVPSRAEVAVAGLRGEQRALGADRVRRAGRRPGVERLVEGDRAAGHGVAVHVEEAEGDLARGAGDGEALAGAGDGLEEAYSGRAPKAVKATHWLVPLRQALMVAVWPSASGPTVSVLVAMPLALVRAAVEPERTMPLPERLPGDGLAGGGKRRWRAPEPGRSR